MGLTMRPAQYLKNNNIQMGFYDCLLDWDWFRGQAFRQGCKLQSAGCIERGAFKPAGGLAGERHKT